nr:unnamed protein product [Callosobruchus analis]
MNELDRNLVTYATQFRPRIVRLRERCERVSEWLDSKMLKFCSPHNRRRKYLAVNPGSKASHAGIREGDLITSIGGRSTKGISNAEAHGLLRAAEGGKLVLGLNEESGGSPKRRQYKTIHQETLQETVKRSNVTTYSSSETIESSQTNRNNEQSTISNEKTINGTSKNIPAGNTLVLQRSTLCSSPSTSSSSSTLKEDFTNTSTDNAEASRRSSYTNCTLSPSTGSLFSEDVGKTAGDMATERTVPISKEWMESPADRVRRFGRSLDSFAGLSKPPKDWVKSLTELDILRETEDFGKSKGIHVERTIPICKNWQDTSTNRKDIANTTDIPVFRDLLQGMKKTEVLKEMDGEVVTETSIPISTESISAPNAKLSNTEYVIPVTKAWEEKDSRMEETISRSGKSSAATAMESTRESHIHKEQVQKKVSSVKEFTIPVSKKWTEIKNPEEYHGKKVVVIPIIKDQHDIQKANLEKTDVIKHSAFQIEDLVASQGQTCKTKEFNIPIVNEAALPIIQEKRRQREEIGHKEVIRDGKDSGTSPKEVIIPIIHESCKQSVCTKNVSTAAEKRNIMESSNRVAGNKEYFIPVERETEKKPKNSAGTKHVNFVPPSEEQSRAGRQNDSAASKEFIIPIMQEKRPAAINEVNVPLSKDWVGLPSEKDPKHLLCLSPKQKEELEKSRKVPQEADKLIDLHEKYYQRITSQELKKTPSQENVCITSIQPIPSTNRLLTIIREEPSTNNEDQDFLYFVEKDPKPHNALHKSLEVLNSEATRSHHTLPRMNNAETARLHARNLNEWLNLARNKSMSESNLSTAPDVPENNLRNMCNPPEAPRRRTSLPNERLERQMIHLQEKEREIQRQLEQLEDERRRLNAEMAPSRVFHPEDYRYSRKGDFAETRQRPASTPAMPTELFRQQMYEEFLDKFAEREERKQQKVIKVSSAKDEPTEKPTKEVIHPVQIEDEFMEKVHQKQQQGKLEKVKSLDKESSAEKEKDEEEPTLIMDGCEVKRKKKLPKHLQEFVDITKQSTATDDGAGKKCFCKMTNRKDAKRINRALSRNRGHRSSNLLHEIDSELVIAKGFLLRRGVWSPGQHQEYKESPKESQSSPGHDQNDGSGIPPVWTPKSANSSPVVERKEFKPVNFQSPVLGRKNRTKSECLGSESPSSEPPWKVPDYSSDSGFPSSRFEKRLPTSHSSPASGFNELSTPTSRLPKAQNPTITLLQKAREGHLPRGPNYIEVEAKPFRPRNDRPPIANPGEVLYQIKHEYTSDSETDRPRKMADLGPRKFEGVGPVTKEGMPLILRSEVKDQNQSKWYKKMYDTIHKQRPRNDEYVTVRYKQRRAQYPYSSGYLSEPEPGAYDSDFTDYKSSSSDILRNTHEQYKNQPGRIENYTPGHSSISEKEAKEWWDEVMDIFDGHLEQQKRVPTHQQQHQGYMSQAFKESGYESDSTLVFRRREEAQQLNPRETREAYKTIQKGGDVPLYGLRKPAPERPKESERLEYIPISPTLTRIRVHKNITPQKEIICYPVTVHHQPPNTFSTYKRTAPSTITYPNIPTPPPIPPPSPPRRRSSRNNPTLRLVSTMKVKAEKSPLCKRHETCFTTTSNIDKSKVSYLKDKITCKLSPTPGRQSGSPKLKVVKKVTTSPDLKNRVTSTLTTTRDPKTSLRKVQSKTNIHSSVYRSKSCDAARNPARPPTSRRSPSEESLASNRPLTRTFGSEKMKFDLRIQTPRIAKSPDLLSPTEVKKAVQTQTKSLSTIYKKSSAVLASTKCSKEKEFIPIKVAITDKARNVLRSNQPSSPKLTRTSPCPSTSSNRPKVDAISPNQTRKLPAKLKMKLKDEKRSLKLRKEQINDDILKKDRDKAKSKRDKTIDKSRKCVGKAEGSEIVKHLNIFKENEQETPTLKEIRRQKEAIETNHFFRHLFLRNISPTPSTISKGSWIIEKTNQLQRRRSSVSDPSIGAMKIYLRHTKPVSDSKFVSLDAHFRSRSASPKSVTFDNSAKLKDITKRSSSLPPKLIFSQTSRPVSPVVQHKKLASPPPSPKLSRSPSSRKIMQIKADKRPQDCGLYMCPSLNQSTTSLDSLKSEDYQRFFNEFMSASRKSDKFKDLNQFYSEIERVGRLEKVFCLKPRTKSEYEIVDFDRWMEVRTREKAEQELDVLYNRIKEEEREKGFLYMPKDINKFKWRQEYDRGLRIKEKSVEDIKEEFEKIKQEEAEREDARRRELAYPKDTYKTLWRGSSVTNMAHTMVERRSQSEGRIKSARQRLLDEERLLDHGIGSRIWSSLSMEQVNILKAQLADIFNGQIPPKPKRDYSVHVPDDTRRIHVPALTVRRNSDSSEQIYKRSMPSMSEDDKKKISQTLSRELLDKIAQKRRDDKKALPLVAPKETLGAVAAAGAKIKYSPKKGEPPKALVKTNALTNGKISSETESGSTDESTRTVICVDKPDDIKKKVEYFEKVKDLKPYTPTIYTAGDEEIDEIEDEPSKLNEKKGDSRIFQSKSCQSMKEYFGESELVKYATVPSVRKHKPPSKALDAISTGVCPLRSEVSIDSIISNDSSYRSESPYEAERQALSKSGDVGRLKKKFEYWEDMYGNITLKRSRSESDINKFFPIPNFGYVDSLRRKYEYPAYSGRGRSRTRRGGVVSPIFLKDEDRFMPHINIISKIASLYAKQNSKSEKERQRSTAELAEILGCPIGEVEKLRDKFDSMEDISLVGHMYTSSPSIRELKDIAPYLAADWASHRYPRFEDNTRSLSSPETSVASRDTSLVRKDRTRPKSTSPAPKPKKPPSPILKQPQKKSRSTDFRQNQKYDPKMHEPVARYQPIDVARYRNGWSEPEPPLPPPKGLRTDIVEAGMYKHA